MRGRHASRSRGMRATRAHVGVTRGDFGGTLLRKCLPTHLYDMNAQAIDSQTLASTVALAGAGDEAAFAQLVATYHVDMARVALVIGGDRELAEDAVQSAWLVAWRKLGSLRDPDRVRPWLLAVTANEARQLLRRRHGPILEIHVQIPGDPGGDPSTGIERLDLRRALARLSPDDRLVLAMRYAVDLRSDELGAALGTSPSAARMRLSRAVDRLRKELRDG
jgi:RNA polymerase sigma factor (sigma-70 family)